MLSRVSAKLLRLSKMDKEACFEVKAFIIENTQVLRERTSRTL